MTTHHPLPTLEPFGDFLLRPAAASDSEAVWTHISQVLAEYGIETNRETTDRDLGDLQEVYWSTGGGFWVVFDESRLVGTLALKPLTAGSCEVCRMYLDRSCRGRGLGRRLLERAIEEARARGCHALRLKTASVLVEAISLYRSRGFAVVPGESACGNCDLVMSLTLEQPSPQ